MTTQLSALLEIERLAREIVDGLDIELVGDCDGTYSDTVACEGEQTITETCKCGEKIEIVVRCDHIVDINEPCGESVQLEADDETKERLRCLRLALVQLDIARNLETK